MPFDRQRHRGRYQLVVANLRRTVTLLMTLMLLGSAAALAGQAPTRAPATAVAPLGPIGAPYQRPDRPRATPQLANLPTASTRARKGDTVIRLSTAALVIIIVLLVLLVT